MDEVDVFADALKSNPLGRMATPQDIAKAVSGACRGAGLKSRND
jgi:hypothetical protein